MNDWGFQIHLKKQLSFIYNYLVKLGATKQDAEDIVQEAALLYIKNIESVPAHKVKGWLFRVSLNRYYDCLRRDKVKQNAWLKLHTLRDMQDLLPEDILIRQEGHNELMNTLDKMPQRYRDFLILKYVFNLRYEDIAQVYELHTGTVKTTIFRAKKIFIQIYKEVQDE